MHELVELTGCGLSPLEAMTAATGNTAAALGIGDQVGTLAVGRRADCIVVSCDPLVDIAALTSKDAIVMVIKDGKIVVDNLTDRGE